MKMIIERIALSPNNALETDASKASRLLQEQKPRRFCHAAQRKRYAPRSYVCARFVS
jgi:hypothetical protein